MPGNNLPEKIAQELTGPISVNDSLSVATYRGFFTFQPDRVLTDLQDHDPFNVWYERNGGVAKRGATDQYRLETDGTQTDSEAVLETAQLGVYRPGTTVTASAGMWLDVEPQGGSYYDMGYFSDTGTEGAYFHVSEGWTLDYVIESARYDGGSITIAQEEMAQREVTEKTDGGETVGKVYGLDPLDDNGPSRTDYQGDHGAILGSTIGWYGPSSIMGWFTDVGDVEGEWVQRVWPLFLYRPLHGPAIRNPNQPISARVNNAGSGQDLQARVGGRQFAVRGEVPLSPQPTFHYADSQTLPMDGTGAGERDWYVVAVIRRKPDDENTALGMRGLSITSAGEPVATITRTVQLSDIDGTVEWNQPVDTHSVQTAIEVDCATDTPDRLTLAEATIDGTTKLRGVGWNGGVAGAGASGAAGTTEAGKIDLETSFGFPFVREYPTVVLATTRSGTGDDVTTSFQVEESG